MGCTVNAQHDTDSEYVTAISKMAEIITQRWRTPWKQPDFLFQLFVDYKHHEEALSVLHGFTRKVIEERKQQHDEHVKAHGATPLESGEVFGAKKRLAFMDALLCSTEDGQPMSLESIQEETDTFMFEGHDTTSSAIYFAIHNIGTHPEIQKKLQQETDEIFGTSNRPVKSEDLSKMKYLECVIKESVRMFSTVPIVSREISEDSQLGSIFLPKGATVTCFFSALHRDPETFPDPDKFDPDRFLPENVHGRHPFAFLPFSAGPRNCIGQVFAMREEKTLLTHLIRNFNFEAIKDEVTPIPDLVLQPQEGTSIRVSRRIRDEQ